MTIWEYWNSSIGLCVWISILTFNCNCFAWLTLPAIAPSAVENGLISTHSNQVTSPSHRIHFLDLFCSSHYFESIHSGPYLAILTLINTRKIYNKFFITTFIMYSNIILGLKNVHFLKLLPKINWTSAMLMVAAFLCLSKLHVLL